MMYVKSYCYICKKIGDMLWAVAPFPCLYCV